MRMMMMMICLPLYPILSECYLSHWFLTFVSFTFSVFFFFIHRYTIIIIFSLVFLLLLSLLLSYHFQLPNICFFFLYSYQNYWLMLFDFISQCVNLYERKYCLNWSTFSTHYVIIYDSFCS